MNIGAVAKLTGLSSKSIRLYEDKGIISPPARSDSDIESILTTTSKSSIWFHAQNMQDSHCKSAKSLFNSHTTQIEKAVKLKLVRWIN